MPAEASDGERGEAVNILAGLIGGLVLVALVLVLVAWIGSDTPTDEQLHDEKRRQEAKHRETPKP